MAAADGVQKLAVVFKPLLDAALKEMETRFKEHTTTLNQDILVKIGTLEGQLAVLEKIISEKKTKPAREKKADKAEGAAEGAAEKKADKAKEDKPQFAVNKLVFFRDEFKRSEEFRNKYFTEELKAESLADPKVKDKKGDALLMAQAQFVWGKLKTDKKEVLEEIEREYKAAEAAFHEANKPAQQNAEPN